MKLAGTRYVLAVQNLKRSADYYIQKLGFKTLWKGDGWHFVIRDSFRLMLGECPDDVPANETGCHSYFAYIDVVDIDELYAEFKTKGVDIGSALENKPWGQREFSVRTVDGHRIMFGEEIS